MERKTKVCHLKQVYFYRLSCLIHHLLKHFLNTTMDSDSTEMSRPKNLHFNKPLKMLPKGGCSEPPFEKCCSKPHTSTTFINSLRK